MYIYCYIYKYCLIIIIITIIIITIIIIIIIIIIVIVIIIIIIYFITYFRILQYLYIYICIYIPWLGDPVHFPSQKNPARPVRWSCHCENGRKKIPLRDISTAKFYTQMNKKLGMGQTSRCIVGVSFPIRTCLTHVPAGRLGADGLETHFSLCFYLHGARYPFYDKSQVVIAVKDERMSPRIDLRT